MYAEMAPSKVFNESSSPFHLLRAAIAYIGNDLIKVFKYIEKVIFFVQIAVVQLG
jgi:hypothetical protein